MSEKNSYIWNYADYLELGGSNGIPELKEEDFIVEASSVREAWDLLKNSRFVQEVIDFFDGDEPFFLSVRNVEDPEEFYRDFVN